MDQLVPQSECSPSLTFTITPGRSGTRLLSELLRKSLEIDAFHEPAPRFNFVFRSFVYSPGSAAHWLATEKVPAILASMRTDTYVETSHLVCKGFIEPMLEIGLKPSFIILHRPPREVASSMLQINSIPERTQAGKLVLLGPSDPGVLWLPNWEQYSDYQLCYWYALEIERRQQRYAKTLQNSFGLRTFTIDLRSLKEPERFIDLCQFVCRNSKIQPDLRAHASVVSINQHPRDSFVDQKLLTPVPEDLAEQEVEICAALSETSLLSF